MVTKKTEDALPFTIIDFSVVSELAGSVTAIRNTLNGLIKTGS